MRIWWSLSGGTFHSIEGSWRVLGYPHVLVMPKAQVGKGHHELHGFWGGAEEGNLLFTTYITLHNMRYILYTVCYMSYLMYYMLCILYYRLSWPAPGRLLRLPGPSATGLGLLGTVMLSTSWGLLSNRCPRDHINTSMLYPGWGFCRRLSSLRLFAYVEAPSTVANLTSHRDHLWTMARVILFVRADLCQAIQDEIMIATSHQFKAPLLKKDTGSHSFWQTQRPAQRCAHSWRWSP